MALAGTVKSTTYDGRGIMLTWNATQNIEKNKSTIEWELNGYGTGGSGWYRAGPFQVTINGTTTTIAATSPRLQLYDGTIIKSGTIDIPHNSNGKKSFTITIKGAIYSSSYNCSGSETFTLDDIPKGAVITSADNFTDEENPTIYYSNPLGNNVDDILACISFDKNADNIPYRSISKTGTSYTFNLTDAEREAIREACADYTSMTVYYYIRTIIDGVKYHSSLAKTVTLVNSAPDFTVEIKETVADYIALTGSSSTFIKGFNTILGEYTATAKKGATIESYHTENEGKVANKNKFLALNTKDNIFVCRVTDSRGSSRTKKITMSMVEYVPLTCTVDADIYITDATNERANITYRIKGNYYNGSFGAADNSLRIDVQLLTEEEGGGAFSSVLSAEDVTITGNIYTATFTREDVPYKDITWIVSATAKDAVTSVNSESKKLRAVPLFYWNNEMFNFNVPVKYNGNKKLFYVPGDSITLGNNENMFPGFTTNSNKDLYFTIPINKPILADEVTITGDIRVRGVDGYVNASADYTVGNLINISDATSTIFSIVEGGIYVKLAFSSKINPGANNTPVVVASYGLDIVFS